MLIYLALPSILGYGGDDRFETEGVIAFITHVTHQHLAVLARVPGNTHNTAEVNTGLVLFI